MTVFDDADAQSGSVAVGDALPAVCSRPRPHKTLLVDRHAMVRESLLLLLDQRLPGQLWRDAATLGAALRMLCHEPDIGLVLLDPDLGDSHGVDTLRRVREVAPRVPVLILSAHDDQALMHAALGRGAAGFLPKSMDAGRLVAGVQRVLAGDVLRPAAPDPAPPAPAGRPELTERQHDVLRLLIDGRSNKRIGRALGLTEATVKTHLQFVYRKLDVENRTQAVRAAARWQLGS